MSRGTHRAKPTKTVGVDASTSSRILSMPSLTTNFSRKFSETKFGRPVLEKSRLVPESCCQQNGPTESQTTKLKLPIESTKIRTDLECKQDHDSKSRSLPNELDSVLACSRTPLAQSEDENKYEEVFDTFEELTLEETYSSASSLYSGDSSSIYSKDSSSIYSSASSIYSNEASTYSLDKCEMRERGRYRGNGSTELLGKNFEVAPNLHLPSGFQYRQRVRTGAVKRQEAQDVASRERSTLAKKASQFKNSRLPPQLPPFSTTLPTWSMACRAAYASQDCYDSHALTRRGTYTPADPSKDIKAMIIDDQLIDDSRVVIISIRGTQCQSLADWNVNKAANPVKPFGFLDDGENACHAGFLQVTKAMVGQVAAQLQQHPASSARPSLLFTGHSAGGAVAAILYSHMLSTTTHSDLTAIASKFPSINCVTFGAPPVSLKPLSRHDRGSGVFLAFANEGDPVLRLSNAAYVKSLAKLMTASLPSSTTSANAPVKVVRRSRGNAVIRHTISSTPPMPWEDLPLWPTPPAPLSNAGDVILLRDKENINATASLVTHEDLREVIFGDLAQHTIEMYIRRVREVAVAAMIGI